MATAQPWWVTSTAGDTNKNASTEARQPGLQRCAGILRPKDIFWPYTICCMEFAWGAKHPLGSYSSTSWAAPACLQHFTYFLNIMWCPCPQQGLPQSLDAMHSLRHLRVITEIQVETQRSPGICFCSRTNWQILKYSSPRPQTSPLHFVHFMSFQCAEWRCSKILL